MDDDGLYSLDLEASFTGETIRNEDQLYRKLEALFEGLSYRDLKVTRQGNDFLSLAVVDKENFLGIIRHMNYGDFPGDYSFKISNFFEYGGDDEDKPEGQDTVLKLIPAENIIDGMDREITITIRRGQEPTDRPARGLQVFNLMANPEEVVKILKHFKIEDKITRVTKATPQRPTLQVRLKEPVHQIFGEEAYHHPIRIYNPTPQLIETGASELWAHLHSSSEKPARKVTVEGIHGVINLEDVKHRLKFHGELTSELQPEVWRPDDENYLSGIPNGEISVYMKLKYELNYLVFGRESFRVTYANQSVGCSICFSWSHRAASCTRRHMGRDRLRLDYLQRWKNLVNFTERSPEEGNQVSTTSKPDSPVNSELAPENTLEPGGSENTSSKPDSPSKPPPEETLEEEGPVTPVTGNPASTPSSEVEKVSTTPTVPVPLTLNNDELPGNQMVKATKNLAKLFEEAEKTVESIPRLEKIANSPGQILENFEEVYGPALNSSEETLATGSENIMVPSEPAAKPKIKAKEHARGGESSTPDDAGWLTVKPRKPRARKSPASSNPSSDSEDGDRKRKAESPRANEVKKTGSGRKIPFFAEQAKSKFFAEHLRFDEKVLHEARNSTVRKETVKRDLLEMEERYYKLIFENPNGKDPTANENWMVISKTLEGTRLLLDEKASIS